MIKTIPANFTLNDLMAYLQEAESPEGFFTMTEWAEHFDCRPERMRQLMVEAKKAGVLEVTKLWKERLDGYRTRVPGYRFDVGDDQNIQAED